MSRKRVSSGSGQPIKLPGMISKSVCTVCMCMHETANPVCLCVYVCACVCVCVCACARVCVCVPAVTAQRLQCDKN